MFGQLFQRTLATAQHGRDVADRMIAVDAASCGQPLTGRADIEIIFAIVPELETGERSIVALAHVPDRNVRNDASVCDEREDSPNPIRRVGREPLGAQAKAVPRTLDHCSARLHLVIPARRGRLDIDNDGVLSVNQVVKAVTEQHAFVGLSRPSR